MPDTDLVCPRIIFKTQVACSRNGDFLKFEISSSRTILHLLKANSPREFFVPNVVGRARRLVGKIGLHLDLKTFCSNINCANQSMPPAPGEAGLGDG
jgi:hypothetical protein